MASNERFDPQLPLLEAAIGEIWEKAKELGLDPFPTNFEVVPATIMYEFGAYGLPGRFSHWTHGKAYHKMKMQYDFGLARIYELVINTNPCHGFLLETNSLVENKLVVAHVLGHSDFFKNNCYFAATNRQMVEKATIDAQRIRQYEFQHGRDRVEEFLDAVLAVQEHVDPFGFESRPTGLGPVRRRRTGSLEHGQTGALQQTKERAEPEAPGEHRSESPQTEGLDGDGFSGRPHDSYQDLLSQEERHESSERGKSDAETGGPEYPQKDLLLFIAENAPYLKDWQRDVILIVRSEMLYFYPQVQTKIMNEGWATYWHARLMRALDLSDEEYMEFARLHASIQTANRMQVNPYHLGFRIFEDIERRWDNPTLEEQRDLGRIPGKGRDKIMEVRETENDESFIRNYLTEDLVEELDLYLYGLQDDEWVVTDKDPAKVRDTLIQTRINCGFPYVVVEDGDHRGNRELLLRHQYDDRELDLEYARKTLAHICRLWGRKAHLQTVVNGKSGVLTCDP